MTKPARQLISEALNEAANPVARRWWQNLLAAANALYTMLYTFHWKSKGANYYSDHELYSRIYESVEEDIDSIAEKAIGTTNDDSFIDAATWLARSSEALGRMTNRTDPGNDPDLFPQAALDGFEFYLRIIDQMKDEFEMNGLLTNGIDDFLQALCNKHEGNVYLLQQRNQ